MKVKGVIKIQSAQLPEKLQTSLEGVEIEYETHFTVHELTSVLDLIPKIPDLVAEAYRKFQQYDQEFQAENEQHAKDEARVTLERLRTKS